MWQVIGVISAVLALIISLIALIISIFTLAASAIFYFKSARQLQDSTRRLQRTMNVLGHYLKATIKDADVDLNFNKEGDIIGLSITAHTEPIVANVRVEGAATLVKGQG